jgi:hypothetical protein
MDLWPEALDSNQEGKPDNPERNQGEQRPVVNVSWHDALP